MISALQGLDNEVTSAYICCRTSRPGGGWEMCSGKNAVGCFRK